MLPWLLTTQNHGFAVANVYRIFLPMSKVGMSILLCQWLNDGPSLQTPLRPIIITVLRELVKYSSKCFMIITSTFSFFVDKATIKDLIGLTFWRYVEETKDPVKLVSMFTV